MTPTPAINAGVKAALRLMIDVTNAKPADLLIMAEQIVIGTFLLVVKLGGDEPVADVFLGNVRERLAEARLKARDTAGRA